MDPYLENPAFWGGVHGGLINAIRAQLNAILPEAYVADVEERHLLHGEEHTVAVPKHRIPRAYDYLVCLHRAGSGASYEVWTVTLKGRLPRVWVPILGGDADVVLDLQQAFTRCYEEGAYHRLVDYRQVPPALSAEEVSWAMGRAKSACAD